MWFVCRCCFRLPAWLVSNLDWFRGFLPPQTFPKDPWDPWANPTTSYLQPHISTNRCTKVCPSLLIQCVCIFVIVLHSYHICILLYNTPKWSLFSQQWIKIGSHPLNVCTNQSICRHVWTRNKIKASPDGSYGSFLEIWNIQSWNPAQKKEHAFPTRILKGSLSFMHFYFKDAKHVTISEVFFETWCFMILFVSWYPRRLDHRENGGTLGMVPLIINPLYKVYRGLIIKVSIPRVPPSSHLFLGEHNRPNRLRCTCPCWSCTSTTPTMHSG